MEIIISPESLRKYSFILNRHAVKYGSADITDNWWYLTTDREDHKEGLPQDVKIDPVVIESYLERGRHLQMAMLDILKKT